MLSVEKVNHDFGGRIILSDVSFRLKKGEHVALVGPNGEGKSTFLKIITNKLMPDEGVIKWSPKAKVGYLDQHAELQKGNSIRDVLKEAFAEVIELEKKMLKIYDDMASYSDEEMALKLEEAADIQTTLDHSGYYTLDAKVEEVANGLGLGDIGLDKDVSELSGGQRTKVLLTKLLLQRPTILLLDEPTNFLDENHIEWLKRYLQDYENSFILISHDIPFINSVATVIYHIENGEFTRYTGNYDDFKKMYDIKKRQAEQAFEKQQKEIEKLEDFIARNKARVATRGMANSRQKKLDKMERIERVREKPKPKFGFRYGRASGKVIFEAKDLVLGYDEALTSPLNMTLERGKRVALKGVNGLGKSTLLKTLLGIIKPYEGAAIQGDYLEVGYFEQESDPHNAKTAIEEVWEDYPALTNLEVRAALAKCGLTNDHIISQMKVLSGGEAAKVRLCKLMLKDINLLVLDEPTNHLDVEAKDELKRAIKAFKGTLIMVSHEPEFYMDLVDEVWNVEDWTTKVI